MRRAGRGKDLAVGMLAYPGRVPEADRPHRPIRLPDLAAVAGAVAMEPFPRAELAAATAAAVIPHGRAGSESLVDLADRVGLDTLAELWRHEQPSSLPGALWGLDP